MASGEITVTCLCAEWCGACRDYRNGFLSMEERFPQARFRWLDVEYDIEAVGDVEVENFPTISVTRGDETLFHGVMPPQHEHLVRLLEKLLSG